MKRYKLVRTLIKFEIDNRRPLVRTACENEIFCFKAYLNQRKSQYENMPLSQLEALAKGVSK